MGGFVVECPACNRETVPGARFCQHCGTPLGPDGGLPSSERPASAPSGQVSAPEEPSPAPGRLAGEPEATAERPVSPVLTTSEWGALTSDDAPPPPDPELPPPAEGPGRPLFPEARPGAGWLPAMGLGALAFLVMLLFAVVLGVVAFLDDIPIVDALKGGALLFFAFHHVAVTVGFPTFDGDAAPGGEGDLGFGPIDISFSLSLALLAATLLALFLLFRAGRRAADQGEGSVGLRLVQGAAVAIPYAALSALLALVVRLQFDAPADLREVLGAGGQLTVSASALQALLWPLVLGLAAGGLGGLASIRGAMVSEEGGRRPMAALSGAGHGLLLTLAMGFAGLLVLAGSSPDLTASYLGQVTDGRSGLVLLVFTVLALPNMVVLGTALGMGGSIVAGEYLGATEHVASLLRFPQSLAMADGVLPTVPDPSPLGLGMAPVGYFFFILVPLVAVLLAGRRAAQRAHAGTPGEGALTGALAGLLWAAALVVLGILAGISFTSSVGMGGLGETQGGFVGPDLLLGAVLAGMWGGLGGALGGILGARGAGAAPVTFEDPLQVGHTVHPGSSTGSTGFEGLAAERRWLEQPEEPPVEEGPAAAETPSDDRAYGFAAPATQGGTASTVEPTEVEETPDPEMSPDQPEPEPQLPSAGLPEPEPSPWSPPPAGPAAWERPEEPMEDEPEPEEREAELELEAQESEAPTEPEAEPEGEREPPTWTPPAAGEVPAPEAEPEPLHPPEPEPAHTEPGPWSTGAETSFEPTADEGASDEEPPSWAVSAEASPGSDEPATPWGGPTDPGASERPGESEQREQPEQQPERITGGAEPAAFAPWEPPPRPAEAPEAPEVPPWASPPAPPAEPGAPTEDAARAPWEPDPGPEPEARQEDPSWLFPPDPQPEDGGDQEELPPWATPLEGEGPGEGREEPAEPQRDED
jgi:hypothetical protein